MFLDIKAWFRIQYLKDQRLAELCFVWHLYGGITRSHKAHIRRAQEWSFECGFGIGVLMSAGLESRQGGYRRQPEWPGLIRGQPVDW